MNRWPLHAALLNRALDLAGSLTAYDALYVALAEVTETPLLTRDRKLARAASSLVEVEVV